MPEWQTDWGGQLRLQDKHGAWQIIQNHAQIGLRFSKVIYYMRFCLRNSNASFHYRMATQPQPTLVKIDRIFQTIGFKTVKFAPM